MRVLVNYANDAYRKAQRWNSWTGMHIGGFDKVYSFTQNDIEKTYYEAHKDILSVKRGNGLWLWKPYFISRVLDECDDGDIVFYADSGAFFVRNIEPLIDSLKPDEKIWVSDCPLLESCFTKQICFEKLQCDLPEIKNSNQIQATYLIFVCCDISKRFVKEWLRLCEDYELMCPEGGLELTGDRGNLFVAHREDQSILSLLCKKSGIRVHKDPSQRGYFSETFYNSHYTFKEPEHPEDLYNTVIFLHKAKNPSLWICIKWILVAIRSKYRYKKARGQM